ncbi:MAG: hypothetical protein NVS4B13_02910 [Candidatus Elarobacter sp.]
MPMTVLSSARPVAKHLPNSAGASLTWLARNAEHFRPALDPSLGIPWRVKPLVELTFLLTTLRRLGVTHPSLPALAAFALEVVPTVEWREIVAYDASATVVLALVAEFCSAFGAQLPWTPAYFDRLIDSGYVESSDRLPYREMDLAYCYERIGRGDFSEQIASWWMDTACGLRQRPAVATIDDVYSLTHAIFYLTDVGSRPLEAVLSEAEARYLRENLVTLTALVLRNANADILGELILCWRFARVQGDPLRDVIAQAALCRLIATQLPEGDMPAPTFDAEKHVDARRFGYNYHPTLVAALTFYAWIALE